jgi:hypothetical protein
MAFVIAKYWGVMPHVVWRYPFRYFKELRDHVIEASKPRESDDSPDETSFDWEEESFKGEMV